MSAERNLGFLSRDSKVFPPHESQKLLEIIEELGGSKALEKASAVEPPTVPADLFSNFAICSITLNTTATQPFDLPTTVVFTGVMPGPFYRIHNSNPPGVGLIRGEGLGQTELSMSDGRIRGPDGSRLNTVHDVFVYGSPQHEWIQITYLDSNREFVAAFIGRWPKTWTQGVVKATGAFQFQL